jgi:serine/threonine protein kinase
MGTVYLASRTVPRAEGDAPVHAWNRVRETVITHEADVLCAIKVISKRTRRDQVKRFIATCELESTVDHPNIVALSGVCLLQKPYLKVSEFMRYGDLKRLLQACTLKKITVLASEQCSVMHQVALALV